MGKKEMGNSVNESSLVSIVIPTMNRKNDLLECLSSIQQLDYSKDRMEILIWDNASNDGTSEAVKLKFKQMAKEGWKNLQIIESPTNIGPYLPYNEVLPRLDSASQYILGIDDDVVLEKESLQKMIEVVRLQQDAGIVGGRIVYYDFPEKTIPSAGWINWWLGKFIDLNTGELTECDYIIGCCWLINKNIFSEVGGFDRDYFTMHWEMDFCSRVQRRGFKIYYQPEAKIKHKIPLKRKRTGIYYLYRNKLLLIKKNATFLQKLTSFALYCFFWLPKIILNSLIANRGVNVKEIKEIIKGIYHGVIGKVGKQEG